MLLFNDLRTPQASHPKKKSIWLHAIIALIFVLTLFQISQKINLSAVKAYQNCGDKNNNHCYGTWNWKGSSYGSETNIQMVQLSCSYGCINDGLIDDEMWFSQFFNTNRACSINQTCWVEVGYIDQNGGLPAYFWADNRPNGGFNFHSM